MRKQAPHFCGFQAIYTFMVDNKMISNVLVVLDTSVNVEKSPKAAMSIVWRIGHAICARLNIQFALGFPEYDMSQKRLGRVLHFWFETEEDAERFYEAATNDMPNLARIDKPVAPTHKVDKKYAYVMRRFAGKPSKTNSDDEYGKRIAYMHAIRNRQRNELDMLPSIGMKTSNGNMMTLFIERIEVDEGEGKPNGYGLSRTGGNTGETNIIAIPC